MLEPLQTSRRKEQGLAGDNQLERGKRRGFRGGSSRVCAILVGLAAGRRNETPSSDSDWARWRLGGWREGQGF